MKIAGISLFNVELPPKGGYSRARSSTIVRVDTDEGVSGFGEVVSYTPGFTEASRAGLAQRGADLIGEDPFHIHRLNRMMDVLFKHDSFDNEVKVAIDIALWDVIGHAAEQRRRLAPSSQRGCVTDKRGKAMTRGRDLALGTAALVVLIAATGATATPRVGMV